MKASERINAFHNLGVKLNEMPDSEFQSLALSAKYKNPWFTEENVRMSVRGIISWLDAKQLSGWSSDYNLETPQKTIAVVMAGNIPLVGFHDFLTILISGHNILIKRSSKDEVLLNQIVEMLIAVEPRFKTRIEYGEQLKGFDAIIATGSDNTARYFEYYFSKYPHIIRKNRTSVAVLDGSESDDQLAALGVDIFSYFGLGCRNISKVYLPDGYTPGKMLSRFDAFKEIIHHHKYCNNYDYQKSILLVTQSPFLDNGFVMLQENKNLFSPLAVVYYEFYEDDGNLAMALESYRNKIQCVVSNRKGDLNFGQAQFPGLGDYADQIDTLKFVTTLS
ncbi:MAG TPA: acyl-CoA reductase [Chryseolinea sp.]|nr:acyl-CoA reductase [Chryseolinea sp.]